MEPRSPLHLPPLRKRNLIEESRMRTLMEVAQAELGLLAARAASPADDDDVDGADGDDEASSDHAVVHRSVEYDISDEEEVFVVDDSCEEEGDEDDYGLIVSPVYHDDHTYSSQSSREQSEGAECPEMAAGSSQQLQVELHHHDETQSPAAGHPSWSSMEHSKQAYKNLRAQWERQARAESGELEYDDEDDDAADTQRAYDEYMEERLKTEQAAEEEAAKRETEERRIREQKRIARERAARVAESQLQLFRNEEARRIEEALEKAEREEQTAEKELKQKQSCLRQMEADQSEDRIEQLRREQEEEVAIARLKDELQRRERSLLSMRMKRTEEEAKLKRQHDAVQAAKERARAKKADRIKAAVECNEHESSLAIRYTRVCTICQTPNPRRRAVFVACGHMACTTCADKMLADNGGVAFPCPFCRTSTTYVKLFEDVDDVAQIPEQSRPTTTAPETRKRKGDNQHPSSSRKRFVPVLHSRYVRKVEPI